MNDEDLPVDDDDEDDDAYNLVPRVSEFKSTAAW
jgi:hypothetical protein